MIVCVCHRVSDRDIARAAREGCASFEELQFELLVATVCGKCRDCAHATFQQHAALDLASALSSTGCAGPARRPLQHAITFMHHEAAQASGV